MNTISYIVINDILYYTILCINDHISNTKLNIFNIRMYELTSVNGGVNGSLVFHDDHQYYMLITWNITEIGIHDCKHYK